LSLKLLIDEDTQAKILVSMLRNAGHDVKTVNEVGLSGKIDELVLEYAIVKNRILLTHNCDDFETLHELNSEHPGILAIYNNDNQTKDMSNKAIVRAIANLEAVNFSLANQFIPLNQWNY
jgi:predicted nuclease of predicted toxin-antitoxin system